MAGPDEVPVFSRETGPPIVMESRDAWVTRDLMFHVRSGRAGEHLERYQLQLTFEDGMGEEVYKYDLGKPDMHGKIRADRMKLRPRNGVFIISAYQWDSKYCSATPEVEERFLYDTNRSGTYLQFEVSPDNPSIGSNTESTGEASTSLHSKTETKPD